MDLLLPRCSTREVFCHRSELDEAHRSCLRLRDPNEGTRWQARPCSYPPHHLLTDLFPTQPAQIVGHFLCRYFRLCPELPTSSAHTKMCTRLLNTTWLLHSCGLRRLANASLGHPTLNAPRQTPQPTDQVKMQLSCEHAPSDALRSNKKDSRRGLEVSRTLRNNASGQARPGIAPWVGLRSHVPGDDRSLLVFPLRMAAQAAEFAKKNRLVRVLESATS